MKLRKRIASMIAGDTPKPSPSNIGDAPTPSPPKWESRVLGVYVILVCVVAALLVLVFIHRLWPNPSTDVVSTVVQHYDSGRGVIFKRDTVVSIRPDEYARVLTEIREQNQFLNGMITLLVTSLTFFSAGAGLFVWRVQQKYEDVNKKLAEATAASQNVEGQIENFINAARNTIDLHSIEASRKVSEAETTSIETIRRTAEEMQRKTGRSEDNSGSSPFATTFVTSESLFDGKGLQTNYAQNFKGRGQILGSSTYYQASSLNLKKSNPDQNEEKNNDA